ncbi:RICIN domain-containing protein [Cellulomonas sp. NPDC055163]
MRKDAGRARAFRRVLGAAGVAAGLALLGAPTADATILPGVHQVMSRQSPGECLTVVGVGAGADVRIATCRNLPWQRWESVPSPFGGIQLRSEQSGLCIRVVGTWNDANVIQDTCDPNQLQQVWFVMSTDNGWSRIFSFGAAKCLDKAGGDITVYDCHGGWWQQWQSLG